jgi:hypothetical protein
MCHGQCAWIATLLLFVMNAGCGWPATDGTASKPDSQPIRQQPQVEDSSPTPTHETSNEGEDSEFFDKDLQTTLRDRAFYRLRRKFVRPKILIEAVPTYDLGMAIKGTNTPLDEYVFNFHRVDDDSLAVSVETIVLRDDPTQHSFSGVGVWYDRQSNMTAKGTFNSGKLDGVYEEFDAAGNVTASKLYDAGEVYDPKRFASKVYRPLVGTWRHESDEETDSFKRLTNQFREDGTMVIYSQMLIRSTLFPDGPKESSRTEATELAWKYNPEDEKNPSAGGVMEFYDGATLIGKSKLAFPKPNVMKSRIIYHQTPALVGSRFSFEKVSGEE